MLICKADPNSNPTSKFHLAFSTQCSFSKASLTVLRKSETFTVSIRLLLRYMLCMLTQRTDEVFKFYQPAQKYSRYSFVLKYGQIHTYFDFQEDRWKKPFTRKYIKLAQKTGLQFSALLLPMKQHVSDIQTVSLNVTKSVCNHVNFADVTI